MTSNNITSTWAAINRKALALADNARAGAGLDELVVARDTLYDAMWRLLGKTKPPLISQRDLHQLLDGLCGAGVHYAPRGKQITRAVERIDFLGRSQVRRAA
jgi:hypothetical protein